MDGGGTIDGLTADASPDSSTDYVMTYDASADSLKKVLLDDLPSSGGVSLPIITDVDILGTVTTAQDINLSLDTAHSTSLTLGADINLTFSSYPTTGTQIEWEVEITQNSTTAFEITWPSELVNPPSANAYSTLDSVTVIVFRTNDGGTTVRVGNTVTTSTTTGASTLSDITINVTKNWEGFGITNLGGITMNDDINFSTVDAINIDRLRFVFNSGAPSSTSDPSIFLDSSSNMVFNVNTLLDISFKALNVEIAKFTEAATGVYLLDMSDHYIDNIESTRYSDDQGAVTFASTQPAIGYDSIDSQFKFNTPTSTAFQFTVDNVDIMRITNSAMTFQTNFQIICVPSLTSVAGINVGGIAGDVLSPANGDIHYNSSTGTFRFYQAGEYVELGGSGTQTPWESNIDAATFDLTGLDRLLFNQTAGESLVTTDTGITSDAIGTMDFNIPPGTQYNFFIEGISKFSISETVVTSQSLFSKDTTDTLGAAGLSWFSAHIDRITMGGFETFIENVGVISFLDTAQSISSTGTDMFFDLPTADAFTFRINSVEVFQIQAEQFEMKRDSTVVTGEPATLSLRKLADSINTGIEIAEINFQTGITTATTWANISGGPIDASGTDNGFIRLNVRANNGLISALSILGDDNNQRFQMICSGTSQFRIQPAFDRMGYFVTPQVTDFSLNLGTAGSIEIPIISDGSPSLTDLNQAFGAFDGAIGHDIFDGTLYIRTSSTEWSFYSQSGTVT